MTQTYLIQFTFTSTRAYGDSYTRTVQVQAHSALEAERIAWMQRVSFFGARGNDNAVDCRSLT